MGGERETFFKTTCPLNPLISDFKKKKNYATVHTAMAGYSSLVEVHEMPF